MNRTSYLFLVIILLAFYHPASAFVKLPAIFADHMVLEQRTMVPVWGWGQPGEKLTIRTSWSKTVTDATADATGKWKVMIATPAAGGPFTIDVRGSNSIRLKDVLIGEVWLCSGQSNMVFSLKGSANAQQEIAQANFPNIRYFSVTRQYASHDFDDSPGAVWEATTPATAPGFSAVAYFFAKKIHQQLNVPVGIVYSAWGGTPAEAWTPEPVLTADTVLSRYNDRWHTIQTDVGKDSTEYHIALAKWEQHHDAGTKKPAEPQTLYYYERPWREPGVLFNGMIDPVIPFAIKGVLWYQGESNVNYADEYHGLLTAMIDSWRSRWGSDLPFYVVQIAAYGYKSLDNAARLREAEYQITKTVPNTGVAVTVDLGDMKNIHYTRKKEVGDRLAFIALARDYGKKDLVYKGPEAQAVRVEKGKAVVSFDASPSGLSTSGQPGATPTAGGTVKGFELGYRSGDSTAFVPADAKIEGDKVVVWNDKVKDPVEVRYAWLLVDQADLYNTAGLPAFPFRMKVGGAAAAAPASSAATAAPASSAATAAPAQGKDLALHMPVYANSENKKYPAANVTDGRITRESKWMSGDVQPPHILEINLRKYCNISRVVVHTGIPEAERTPAESAQAAGFWSAKNFKLQYWDDANWTDIPSSEVHENRLTDVPFNFSPAINTYKLRFVCDDGEPISIMEIEVFGKATGNMAPAGDAGASDLEKKSKRTADQALNIRIADSVIGKTMRYVGYNQGYFMPGSNATGWLEYAGVNSLRIWTTLDSYVPAKAVQVDEGVRDVNEFDKRKAALRADPEHNSFLKWEELLPIYEHPEKEANTNHMILSYVLTELKRLKIDPVVQVGSRDFDSTWGNKWKQWQRYYALAYYCARVGDVTMYAMQNEPNHKNSGPMKLDQWIGGMQIVSDALSCAIEDVDKRYGKNLKARMVGPVTAGNNREWWTAVAKSQRTDYHGKTIDHDLLGIFSTHSYNSPAAGYLHRVEDIRKILADNQPGGKPLPIVYTEIGRWMNAYLIDKEETMDDPSLFTEWAGIYTNNTLNGAYGMWAFKFANTTSSVYPLGIKSGHHFTWQGQRIVEDAYTDLAKGRPVTASSQTSGWAASNVTDGDKSDRSAWHSDASSAKSPDASSAKGS
ncbi:MAG TPA: sialate O-acetylesterase, partial [Puia sp.]